MSAAKVVVSEAEVLSAFHAGDWGGTPTYVLANRLGMIRGAKIPAAAVRHALNRLESLGKVHRTRNTLPNSVVWAKGPYRRHPLAPLSPSTVEAGE